MFPNIFSEEQTLTPHMNSKRASIIIVYHLIAICSCNLEIDGNDYSVLQKENSLKHVS